MEVNKNEDMETKLLEQAIRGILQANMDKIEKIVKQAFLEILNASDNVRDLNK